MCHLQFILEWTMFILQIMCEQYTSLGCSLLMNQQPYYMTYGYAYK